MKYRIIEKKAPAPLVEVGVFTVFVPQEKYKFWPFWFNLGRCFVTLEKAETCIKNHKVIVKTVIHEFDEKV